MKSLPIPVLIVEFAPIYALLKLSRQSRFTPLSLNAKISGNVTVPGDFFALLTTYTIYPRNSS
jgi:hypothetical protein